MIDTAQKSLLGKALARPDLVRQVIAKAQAEGILEAWRQASEERKWKGHFTFPSLLLFSWSSFSFCTFPLPPLL